MSRVTPASAATSSIDVLAKPVRAKAAAAAVSRAACRSALGSSWRCDMWPLETVYTSVYSLAMAAARETAQVEYTEEELLTNHDYAEPLVAGGVVCHGGFDDEGTYVSPRTKMRVPAIEAWQAQHARQFDTDLLDLPLDTWPTHYPNVAQAKHLIAHGVPEPVISTLTRIGTVEGFGAMIRHSMIPDLQANFDEE